MAVIGASVIQLCSGVFKTRIGSQKMSSKNSLENCQLGSLLESSTDVKIYTCEDFRGNVEVNVGHYMYLFYCKDLSRSKNMSGEFPIQSFDMRVESVTPGTNNFIKLNIVEASSLDEKLQLLTAAIPV